MNPTTPALQRLQAYIKPVWAVPLSLTTTQGIALLSLPEGTEMVQFTSLASTAYIFNRR